MLFCVFFNSCAIVEITDSPLLLQKQQLYSVIATATCVCVGGGGAVPLSQRWASEKQAAVINRMDGALARHY